MMTIRTLLVAISTLPCAISFVVIPSQSLSKAHHRIQPQTIHLSSPDEEQELILGDQMSQALSSIGSTEQSILDASRRRSEEAKAAYQAAYEQELIEAEAKRREREMRDKMLEDGYVDENDTNAGPGDMSSFVGFANDGFEDSDENGAGWDMPQQPVVAGDAEVGAATGGNDGEEPQLFLFNDNDGGDNGSGLIL